MVRLHVSTRQAIDVVAGASVLLSDAAQPASRTGGDGGNTANVADPG
jgi:2-polyprenyl-6-methoxyphenol hydroxylase-like FAD-dependent oxidoreductase